MGRIGRNGPYFWPEFLPEQRAREGRLGEGECSLGMHCGSESVVNVFNEKGW